MEISQVKNRQAYKGAPRDGAPAPVQPFSAYLTREFGCESSEKQCFLRTVFRTASRRQTNPAEWKELQDLLRKASKSEKTRLESTPEMRSIIRRLPMRETFSGMEDVLLYLVSQETVSACPHSWGCLNLALLLLSEKRFAYDRSSNASFAVSRTIAPEEREVKQ